VAGDTLDEANESFTLGLSGASGAAILNGSGTGTIVDDDPATVTGRRLTIGDVTVHEGDAGTRTAVFTVSLDKASTSTVKVNYATVSASATKISDFLTKTGSLSFAPGVTSLTIQVTINPDDLAEGNETFKVKLSGAYLATITDGTGLGTIVDDD